MVYEIKCAWCGKDMGTKEDAGSDFAEKLKSMGLPVVSHYICPDCSKKALGDAELKMKGDPND
jgi:DNA-directed RNA polymerase subunit RPC12/RpoP